MATKEYNQAYYSKHKEALKQQVISYRKAHPELVKKWAKTSKDKHKAQIQAWSKTYYLANKESYYKRHAKYRYGLSQEAYNALMVLYPIGCPICIRPFTERRIACIDHDHKTSKVRGLLCKSCNIHLGWFETYRDRAPLYLDKYGT